MKKAIKSLVAYLFSCLAASFLIVVYILKLALVFIATPVLAIIFMVSKLLKKGEDRGK